MVVVLPAPLTPTTRTTAGGSNTRDRSAFAGLQDFEEAFANQVLQFGDVGKLVAFHALTDAIQNLVGRIDPDIGGDQRVFELIEQVGIDFLLPLQRIFERVHQAGASLLDAAFELLKKGGFLFNGAE